MSRSFYKRELPSDTCIQFSSDQGRQLLIEALQDGTANFFFPLMENLSTQSEPAYCGISTLCVMLNTLGKDPGRVWRGVWRWYSEEMLSCVDLEKTKNTGITLDQMGVLANCNGAHATVHHAPAVEEKFLEALLKPNSFVVASYSRKTLGQTGDGHFSPIGAYHRKSGKVLILDVARFKYPYHWIDLSLLMESMTLLDSVSGKPRGYMVFEKRDDELFCCPTFILLRFPQELASELWQRFSAAQNQLAVSRDPQEVIDAMCNGEVPMPDCVFSTPPTQEQLQLKQEALAEDPELTARTDGDVAKIIAILSVLELLELRAAPEKLLLRSEVAKVKALLTEMLKYCDCLCCADEIRSCSGCT